MIKSLKALETTSNDGANETPRSISGRYMAKRHSVAAPRDKAKILVE